MEINIFSKRIDLTDVEVVQKLQEKNEVVESFFYKSCHKYFMNKYSGVFKFSSGMQEPMDLFHDSYIILWTEIESKKINTFNNYLCRVDKNGENKRMSANLKTYLMSIAKYKNDEQMRENVLYVKDFPYDKIDVSNEDSGLTANMIVKDSVNNLPSGCQEILTLFYYEGKTLDEILEMRKLNVSKDGLKTSKSKCLKKLKFLILKRFEKNNIRL